MCLPWAGGLSLACSTAGQHLLSAACDEVAGADTVSWELHPRPAGDEGSDSVCVDLAVPHLSSEQLRVKLMLGMACQHNLCMWSPPLAMQEIQGVLTLLCAILPLKHAVDSLADVQQAVTFFLPLGCTKDFAQKRRHSALMPSHWAHRR